MDNFVIVIPAYNEEGRIGATIAAIRKCTNAGIIVISDGSVDGTVSEAKAAGADVIELPFNLGYGAALQTGFKYALMRGYAFAVQMDADGQHDPVSIGDLIKVVENGEVDIVIGSRFSGGGSYKAPLIRRVGMCFFAVMASLITGKKITDPTSGFQALNRKVMEFYASKAYPVDYPDTDVIIMLYRKGFKFMELPVVMHKAPTAKSMHGGIIRPLYYIFKMMLSIFVTLLRRGEQQ